MSSNRFHTNQRSLFLKSRKVWIYLLTTLVSLSIIIGSGAGIGTAYITWRTYSQLEVQQNRQSEDKRQWARLNYAEEAAVAGDYLTCSTTLRDIPSDSIYDSRVRQLMDKCRRSFGEQQLSQAEDLATQGRLKDAIIKALEVEPGPIHAVAQQRVSVWSRRIIELAVRDYYAQSTAQIDDVIGMLLAIPEGSPLYTDARSLIDRWQKEWADNQHYAQAARLSLDANDLTRASQAAQSMTRHLAWADQRSQLLLEIQETSHTFDQLAYEAENHLRHGRLAIAAEVANALPDIEPWRHRKMVILSEVQDAKPQLAWFPVVLTVVATLFFVKMLSAFSD